MGIQVGPWLFQRVHRKNKEPNFKIIISLEQLSLFQPILKQHAWAKGIQICAN